MTGISRRNLIGTGAAAGVGAAAAVTGLAAPAFADDDDHGHGHGGRRRPLFPPLQSAPGDLLALPEGFSYELVAVTDQTRLTDGRGNDIGVTPCRPDGTLAVRTRTGYRLIQNHEVTPPYGDTPVVPQVAGTVYDEGITQGGCTVIDLDHRGRRRSEWVGISGVLGNCAGGPTPWGSWLTCEESELKAGEEGCEKDHGYVFEVFAKGPDHQAPMPIEAWGRAPHEAVVIEPSRRRAYLTEDSSKPTGLLYRWTAPGGYRLHPGIAASLRPNSGRLEALAVRMNDGSVLPDLAYVTGAQIGRPFQTSWVEVPDRHATDTPLRSQFDAGEVTHSKKLEGAWGDAHGMYFVASFAFALGDYPNSDLPNDATKHNGQLWYYRYSDSTLTLQAYFPYDADVQAGGVPTGPSLDLSFDGPDGCHVSPYGSLVLSEDGVNAQHILSWSRETGAQPIARNLIPFGDEFSEMTGPCFSPDGKILFFNVQEPGHVFAVTGPWRKYLR